MFVNTETLFITKGRYYLDLINVEGGSSFYSAKENASSQNYAFFWLQKKITEYLTGYSPISSSKNLVFWSLKLLTYGMAEQVLEQLFDLKPRYLNRGRVLLNTSNVATNTLTTKEKSHVEEGLSDLQIALQNKYITPNIHLIDVRDLDHIFINSSELYKPQLYMLLTDVTDFILEMPEVHCAGLVENITCEVSVNFHIERNIHTSFLTDLEYLTPLPIYNKLHLER